ncbi:tRNA pseudouridine synthase 1 [Coniosporium tulheliwenetii]|uniref:tRNA pseudouridine synthase 1 n=1 Tax=Coniosporium tulheliwenetii TaxID=3383036 RepID=A0ACC2YW00_9PEZI|nr:tRNA pseudouridine synthase 1 [Cladosporium sp. JES 115]
MGQWRASADDEGRRQLFGTKGEKLNTMKLSQASITSIILPPDARSTCPMDQVSERASSVAMASVSEKPMAASETTTLSKLHSSPPPEPRKRDHDDEANDSPDRPNKRKRGSQKRAWERTKFQHGSRNKKKDLGRGEYLIAERTLPRARTDSGSAQQLDRRGRNEAEQNKRRKTEGEGEDGGAGEGKASVLPAAFSKEEIAAEDRRPKRKVAVMIGYSGSGYKGMQINTTEKTIEGDLFTAFVAAGAISKANADDPKKSALVRCARTDKGVHAAGNVISLKLIVEDEDIVQKINSHLSPQIRVWGIERTIGSFSCYQACDSRWYEYLIPTHCFLPPHPSSFLGKKLVQVAEECGDSEGYQARQEEVKDFWAETEEKYIAPILEELDPEIKELVLKALYDGDADPEGLEDGMTEQVAETAADIDQPVKVVDPDNTEIHETADPEKTEEAAIIIQAPSQPAGTRIDDEIQPTDDSVPSLSSKLLDAAIKRLKAAYLLAKRRHRIPPARLARLQTALTAYEGTHSYHNYTIQKSFRDPSAKRLIKSFRVAPTPITIGDTEWLSLKVHGQSFMMHQIRKMVGMAALVVRCGTPIERIGETFGAESVSVPKGGGEVWEGKISFEPYEKEMEEFKQREIYERIFGEEERDNTFHAFFAHIDSYREPYFLWVTSGGIPESKKPLSNAKKGRDAARDPDKFEADSEDEADRAAAGEGEG